MQHNQVSLAVLVKGRPITEYYHQGQVFVEGRAGSEYEVEVTNNTAGQIEAILSVDGLSVTDGKAAGQQSRGYLLESFQTLRVPGWTLDMQNVAKFAFSGKDKSYATQMTGDARNNGVIGIMAYAPKFVPPVYRQYPLMAYAASASATRGAARGISPSAPAAASASWSMTSPSVSTQVTNQSVIAAASAYDVQQNTSSGILGAQQNLVNSLGTAFGDAQTFATTKVQFSRGDMLSYFVLYYDNLKGLRARGVKIERVRKGEYKSVPEAFPAMNEGCVPPPNWQR